MKRSLLSLFVLALCAQSVTALVIRHDVATIDYENYGKNSKFNSSTGISRGDDVEYGIAGATAIDSRWGVHARHTLRNVQNYMDQAGKTAVLRGTKWNGWNNQGLFNRQVSQVIYFDDDFTRFAAAIDIAVVQTVAASSTLKIAQLNTGWDEVGRVGSGVSAANNRTDGNGNSRKTEAQNTSNSGRWYEVRWGGKNDINQVNTQALGSPNNAVLKVDMDHPTTTSYSTMGGNTAIDLEYGTANGDSGSPIYIDKNGIDGQVAGVVSGGTGSGYGSTVYYCRVRPYYTWITDTILANPDNRSLSIAGILDQVVEVGGSVAATGSATSSESAPLSISYRLINPPAGATINASSGVVSWSPSAAHAGTVQTITVEAYEDGVVGNTAQTSFDVTVLPSDEVTFWSWSAGPPAWSSVNVGGGGPYNLGSASYPFIQGNTNNMIYQQISGTLPAWVTVTVQIKAADFNQSWSDGGPLEFGFRSAEPTVGNAATDFTESAIANVLNYDSATAVADGLGNTGGNVDYFFSFFTTQATANPWFAVRKNADGNRLIVDDIVISYHMDDADGDDLADQHEISIGTDPDLADTDGDGFDDGDEVALGTDPLSNDSDLDGYSDGYEVNTLSTDPLDANAPGGSGVVGIGINFIASSGQAPQVGLPVHAYGGLPSVAQKNWNQTTPFSANNGTTARIASPQAGVLVDGAGAATGATVTLSMSNLWSTANETHTPYGGLYSGYLDTSAGTPQAVVDFANIPYANYDVYVYFGANVDGRIGTVSDGTTTYSFTSASRSTEPGTYVQTLDTGSGHPEANYAVFSGQSTSSLAITYQRVSGNGGIYAVQIVPSAYDQWAISKGLDPRASGARTLDLDVDGISNALEFVLFSNPGNASERPVISMAETSGDLSLTYTKAKAADAITTFVEWSENLTDWYTTGISESQMSEDNESRTIKGSVSKNGRTALFLRVNVENP